MNICLIKGSVPTKVFQPNHLNHLHIRIIPLCTSRGNPPPLSDSNIYFIVQECAITWIETLFVRDIYNYLLSPCSHLPIPLCPAAPVSGLFNNSKSNKKTNITFWCKGVYIQYCMCVYIMCMCVSKDV